MIQLQFQTDSGRIQFYFLFTQAIELVFTYSKLNLMKIITKYTRIGSSALKKFKFHGIVGKLAAQQLIMKMAIHFDNGVRISWRWRQAAIFSFCSWKIIL